MISAGVTSSASAISDSVVIDGEFFAALNQRDVGPVPAAGDDNASCDMPVAVRSFRFTCPKASLEFRHVHVTRLIPCRTSLYSIYSEDR